MDLKVAKNGPLRGTVIITSSNSQTIRGVVFGSLAEGVSEIKNPLKSADTMASVNGCRALGAKIDISDDKNWIIEGVKGKPRNPEKPLDLANSGTSLNLITGVVSLGDFEVVLDGDESLRKRPVQPLLNALNILGVKGASLNADGCPPIRVQGKIKGGRTKVDGISSQFVSSLLISTPLAEKETEIEVANIHEVPYIEMTLQWLDEQKIRYERNNDFTFFGMKGKQNYKPFKKNIPGDWSSATFLLVAGAITESDILLKGLDVNDIQGDKIVVEHLKKMGADIKIEKEGIRVKGGKLRGAELDLNSTPDALPALAVLGCFAEGTTRLYNVAHARIKETDRIKVMTEELSRMNADVKETRDGMVINRRDLKGAEVNGHHDHRVIMALSLAGIIARGTTKINTAEAVDVTFPGFVELMRTTGANMKMEG